MKNKIVKLSLLCTLFLIQLILITGCSINSSDSSAINEDKLARDLIKTPFLTKLSNDISNEVGLNDARNVGIDEDKFYNEVKYPIPTEVDYVINVTDYGVIAGDNKDDTVGIQKAIEFAKNQPNEAIKKIVLPEGDITIVEGFNTNNYRYGIDIENVDNLILQGDNTNIYIYGTLSGFKGIYIKNCENFQIANVNIDWGTLPFSMGVVESSDVENKTIIVKVNDGYKVDKSTEVIEYLEFNAKNNLPRENGNFRYIHNANKLITDVEYLGDQKLKIVFKDDITKAPSGTKVVLAHTMTMSETFFIEKSKNVKFENINLYSSPGMAVKIYTSENLYFNRFRAINKPGTDRLMTATADILHIKNCAGEIVITNSQFENSHDDAINIGGHFLRVKEIRDDGKVRVISPLGMIETFRPEVGDKYEVTDVDTLEVNKVLTISSVELCFDGYYVTFEEDIENLEIDNALANATRVPSLIFKNNLVRNKRNRGLLCQTRNAIIENNTFSNILHGAILLITEVNDFHESISPKNIQIKNNKFVDNNQFAEADITAVAYGKNFSIGNPGVISNINIENNFMAYSRNSAIALKGVSDVNILNNYIYSPAMRPLCGGTNSALLIQNVKDITINNNYIEENQDLKFKSIFMNQGVNLDTMSLQNNVGIDLEDIFGKIKVQNISKNTSKINVNDNSLTDWSEVDNTVNIIGVTDKNLNQIFLSNVDNNDFSAIVKVSWDDLGIYIGYDVKDNDLNFLKEESYFGDIVEIYLTTELNSYQETSSVRLTNDNTLQIWGRTNEFGGYKLGNERTSQAIIDKENEIIGNMWETNSGYAGEVFIPFTVIPGAKQSIDAGIEIAMSINFFDKDNDEETVYFSTTRHPVHTNMRTPAFMNKFKFEK